MLFFTKRLRANRLARKCLRIVFAEHGYFRLWQSNGIYEYLRSIEKGGIMIETSPNVYFDGADSPDVFVFHQGTLVLKAIVPDEGEDIFGRYRIDVFHQGEWTRIINELYEDAIRKKEKYYRDEKMERKRNFSAL